MTSLPLAPQFLFLEFFLNFSSSNLPEAAEVHAAWTRTTKSRMKFDILFGSSSRCEWEKRSEDEGPASLVPRSRHPRFFGGDSHGHCALWQLTAVGPWEICRCGWPWFGWRHSDCEEPDLLLAGAQPLHMGVCGYSYHILRLRHGHRFAWCSISHFHSLHAQELTTL